MVTKKRFSLFATSFFFLLSMGSYADSVGVDIGIFNGIALTYQKPLSDHVHVQVELTTAPYDNEFEQDGIDYDIEYDRDNLGVLIQYVPYKYFYLAGGLYVGDHNWKLDAKPQGNSREIGDHTYYSKDLRLKGQASFSKSSPYLGIGAKYAFDNGLTLRISQGVLYIGEGALSYKASGRVYSSNADLENDENGFDVSNAVFVQDLEKERAALEDEISDYSLLPMFHVGMAYTF